MCSSDLRMVINEFVAYSQLGPLKGTLDPKSFTIATFALCGFANFSSIGMQIGGIGALAASGGAVVIVLNGEIWSDSLPTRYRDLPAPTVEHIGAVVVPALANAGVTIDEVRWMDADEAHAIQTTWARRLGHGRPHPRFLLLGGHRH